MFIVNNINYLITTANTFIKERKINKPDNVKYTKQKWNFSYLQLSNFNKLPVYIDIR